jgi:hypothetical protein
VLAYWYVCNGNVAKYDGQQPDWKSSVLVIAASPEEALLKVMRFHQGLLERVETVQKGKTIAAIV